MQQAIRYKQHRPGIWMVVAVLLLIGAATYAWPSVLKAIEKGAYEGAKAGAEAAVEKSIDKAVDRLTPSWAK